MMTKSTIVISMIINLVESMKKLMRSLNLEQRIVMIIIHFKLILTIMRNPIVSIQKMRTRKVGNYLWKKNKSLV